MGFESISPLPEDHAVDISEVETSQVMSCDSTVIEKVEKSLSEEPFLLVLSENKENKESLGTTCYLDNIAEAITPMGDALELSISSEAPDVGCRHREKASLILLLQDQMWRRGHQRSK